MNYESYLNRDIAAVPPSGIRRFFDIAATMKDAISLGVGEPDFVTPYHIRNAAINSILDGETQYTGNRGLPELLREIAFYLESRCGVSYNPNHEILVTVGASEAIDIALRAIISPGDEVLVPEPSYVSYSPSVIFAGGTPVGVETTADAEFRLTAENVRNAITPRTKALILPYPNNPTGGIMPREDLEKLAEVIREKKILVISDEIYSELTYGGLQHVSFASLPGMWDYTLTINGFSKAFAMTGWRVGYLCGPEPLLSVMLKIHQYSILCAPRAGQVAAAEALRTGRENGYEDVIKMRESYDRRRRLMVEGFRSMGLDCFEPLGAFYVFPSIKSTGLCSEEFCTRLLNDKKVACVPGTAFGACGEGHIRCSYATGIDKLNIALDKMSEFVKGL
ncbi:MAG: aminotransferase class I/II-fold pyridoxal phosphate-dependent enzyme [Eubacteriales bacterium]|nr:aminotransferase class I/II-fold pyridoxal phosphate-dependent enzyme [Eubacteriales bacterium]